jgi:SH3 domain protein
VKKLLCLVLCSLCIAPVFAQERYISDKLFTYVRSGPANDYRIIGSVDAGEKVELLSQNKSSGYSEIVDSNGRKGWVETKFINRNESNAVRLPRLEKELSEVKALLANAQQSSDSKNASLVSSLEMRNKQISDLEKTNAEISKKLTSSQNETRELRAKLDTQKEDMLMKYFTYGGGVALFGILFGIVLPHIIPRRRKHRSDWV